MRTAAAIIVAGLALGACATQGSGPHVVAAASDKQQAMFDQLKALDGKWEVKGENGKTQVACVFAVSSNDSIVREIMFPGTPHEMTNVYHMDGPSVILTHYCAMGNQPRMRATACEKGEMAFHFDSITNMTDAGGGYMGEMTIAFKDKNHITEKWLHMKDGKTTADPTVIELTRAR